MIKPVRRTSLVDSVVEQLRGLVEQGKLRAGDRLPSETDLVQQLQVSRPVLREAMNRLETVGVVNVQRGRGTFVGDRKALAGCARLLRSALTIAPKDLLEFAGLREALECWTARQAAHVISLPDLAELDDLCNQMELKGHQAFLEGIEVDFRFHRKLAEVAGNEAICNVMEVVQEFMLAGIVQTTLELRYPKGNRQVHEAIVVALRARDDDAAEKAMRAHMKRHRDFLRRRLSGAE